MQIYTSTIDPINVFKQGLQLSLRMLLGAVVTLLLFIMMYQLINTDDIVPPGIKTTRIVNFLMPAVDIPVYKQEELIKPVPPMETPDRPTMTDDPEPTTGGIPIQTSFKWNEQSKLLLKPSRSEAIPIFRVDAVYPSGPLARGIQGFVDLLFDVDEIGATKNIQVLAADPPRIFNRAAKKAVAKWKYEPKVVDGEGVYQSGLNTRIRFVIKQ